MFSLYNFNTMINSNVFHSCPFPGGSCSPGEFCPEGSAAPVPCTSGSYCDVPELSTVTGPCDAGHYCTLGALRADPPTGDPTGGLCTAGHYCPAGTGVPEDCPPGTYGGTTGKEQLSECVPCTAGEWADNLLFVCI